EGLVMAAPRALSDPAYAPVAAAEVVAREEGLGIWSNPLHRVLCAAQAKDGLDQYRVVMGKLLGVGETRGTLYLNFGPDWRTDFTVRLRLRSKARRAEARKQAEAWVGGWLEVRGWLHFFSGPMIDVTSLRGLRTLTPEGSVERDLKRCQG
ncbi:MAG: hypothetical protein V3R73_04270, partial [Sphingomonadales bacterium]